MVERLRHWSAKSVTGVRIPLPALKINKNGKNGKRKLVLSGNLESSVYRRQHEELKIVKLVKRFFKNKRKEKIRNYD